MYEADPEGLPWGVAQQQEGWGSRAATHSHSSHSYRLAERTFRTFDFYKRHQDAMTPAGLAFFQCRWDASVTHVFHQLLGKAGV